MTSIYSIPASFVCVTLFYTYIHTYIHTGLRLVAESTDELRQLFSAVPSEEVLSDLLQGFAVAPQPRNPDLHTNEDGNRRLDHANEAGMSE